MALNRKSLLVYSYNNIPNYSRVRKLYLGKEFCNFACGFYTYFACLMAIFHHFRRIAGHHFFFSGVRFCSWFMEVRIIVQTFYNIITDRKHFAFMYKYDNNNTFSIFLSESLQWSNLRQLDQNLTIINNTTEITLRSNEI